jgi:hypothetical protein
VCHGNWTHLNGVLYKFRPSVCVPVCVPLLSFIGKGSAKYIPHFGARQRLGKHVPAATNMRNNNRIVGRACLWVCLRIPLSLLGNNSVNTFPLLRRIVGGVVFYAVRVETKESRLCFLGFPLSLSNCRDGSQVPSCYCVPLMQPSRLKFIKIKLLCWQSHNNYIFKIILNLKSKFRGPPFSSQCF